MKADSDNSIKSLFYLYLKDGMTNKQEIYTAIVDRLGVPRPTVRRVAIKVRKELLSYSEILNVPAKSGELLKK
jgi:hypothetical protein